MENKLPKNWVETEVGDISEIVRGITYNKLQAKPFKENDDYLVLRGGNIQDGKITTETNDVVYVESGLVKEVQQIKKGDVVIVGSTGSKRLIGKAGIAKQDFKEVSFGAFLMLIRPSKSIESSLFDYYFISDNYRNVIRNLAGGVNINNIRREYITNLKYPLPPLAEQQRIVAKLDELFGHLDSLKTRLNHIPQILKNFRQAVLTQAVTGKLTEEWRIGKELDPYMTTITKNRKEYYKERIANAKNDGDRKPKKLDETDFEFYNYESNVEMPKGWKLANLKNIADLLTDGEHATPRRTESGYYLLSARNVRDGFISLEKVDYVPEDEYLRIKKRCNPEFKDVLISCSGSVGRVSTVPKGLEFVMVRSAALVKLQSNKEISKFVELSLRSRVVQNQILTLQKSTAQANLFLGQIGKIVVPIPSKEEQTEIVKRVEHLFEKADAIESQYKTLKTKMDSLPQAILAKAFKGELVEQLDTDGDAKVLLEEIQKLKTSLRGTKQSQRKKKKD